MRFLLFLHFICSIKLAAQSISSHPAIQIINNTTLTEAITNPTIQLIDVRTTKEYSEGYIAFAKNIPIKKRKNFKMKLNQLDKQKPIYLYCYSGVRSKRASRILKKAGFTTIYDYRGGWQEWTHLSQ